MEDLPESGYINGYDGNFVKYTGGGEIKGAKDLSEIFFDGTSERCTFDHLFLTKRGWIEAQDLKIGDACIKYNLLFEN